MKTVASTLGVARSNLIERRDKVIQARGPYRKAEDAGLLLPIRAIIDERPTYGYRRVWALLNRHLRSAGKPTVNMKRVLRIMQNHGLTLERHTARRPGHSPGRPWRTTVSPVRWYAILWSPPSSAGSNAHARHIQSTGCPTTEMPTSPRTLPTSRALSA